MTEAEVSDSRKKPQAEACRCPLEAGKGRAQPTETSTMEGQLPEPLEGMQSCRHLDLSPARPIWGQMTSRALR